jgi:hypothetical protein
VPVPVCHDEVIVERCAEQAGGAKTWLEKAMVDGMEERELGYMLEGENALALYTAWLLSRLGQAREKTYVPRALISQSFLYPKLLRIPYNLSAAKPRVRELVEEWRCKLLYLSPYSPDQNPVEEACSKIKGMLCKGETRSTQPTRSYLGSRMITGICRSVRSW